MGFFQNPLKDLSGDLNTAKNAVADGASWAQGKLGNENNPAGYAQSGLNILAGVQSNAGTQSWERGEAKRGLGAGTYNSFDPRWSARTPFKMGNPWALGRDVLALGSGGLGPGAVGVTSGLALGVPNANMYSAWDKRDKQLKDIAGRRATATRNRDVAAQGQEGTQGSYQHGQTSHDVATVLAQMQQERMNAQMQYEAQIMDQLQMFGAMFGQATGMGGGV